MTRENPIDVLETVRQAYQALLLHGSGLTEEHRRLFAASATRLRNAEASGSDEEMGRTADMEGMTASCIASELLRAGRDEETRRNIHRLAGHLLDLAAVSKGEYPSTQ